MIGTGEMSELTARALAESGARIDVRRNAPADRAEQPRAIATAVRASSFYELPSALERADVVVAATASPHLLIEARRDEQRSCRARDGRPMLLIDLAVPRDIDAECAEIPMASRCTTSTISQAVIARNRRVRQAEARKAEGIIEEEIQHFADVARLARGTADARGAARARTGNRQRDRA